MAFHEVRFPDKRRRDVHNLLPHLGKPLVDGIVDAEVLPDDSDEYLIGPDMRHSRRLVSGSRSGGESFTQSSRGADARCGHESDAQYP